MFLLGSVRASDLLPTGGEWFGEHYYLVVTDEMNWADAKAHAETLACGEYSAHLVTLETEEENDYAKYCRSAFRGNAVPGHKADNLGFRPVRSSAP